MTWNVNGPVDDEDGTVKKRILEEIERLEPDIICFQELSSKNYKSIQRSLDSLYYFSDIKNNKKNSLLFWIYSKKPIRNLQQYKCITEIDTTGFDSFQLKEIITIKDQMPLYSAEIEVKPGKWITLFAVHLRSSAYSTARRSMREGSSWYEGIPLYFDNFRKGAKIRNYEAENLVFYLDSLKTNNVPIILAGDFNDWSGSYCMNTIRNGKYKDAWWENGLGFGITYDEWHLKLRLDHILYSPHFELENVFIKKTELSDHFPLLADFNLK